MKISTKGRYALRLFIDLAEHQNGGFVSLKDIAERQGISRKYLEQIVAIIGKSNLLVTGRGFQGGYKLSRTPDKYTVGEILRLTEGSLSPVQCVDGDLGECAKSGECATLPIWQGLSKVINEYLDSISLEDVIQQKNAKIGGQYMI